MSSTSVWKNNFTLSRIIISIIVSLAAINSANATLIDFEDRATGEILSDQYHDRGLLFSGAGNASGLIVTIPQYSTGFFGNTGPNILHMGARNEPTTITFVEPNTNKQTYANNISLLAGDGDIDLETFTISLFGLNGDNLFSQTYTTTNEGFLFEYAGNAASIQFTLAANSSSGASFDNFNYSLVTVVPEPATVLLFLVFAGLLMIRFRYSASTYNHRFYSIIF
ncbi:hypothetical protein H0A36_01970 [Endozoicomonas sp. SM1973]|uniref:PEP-CTERM protein-sorting domain-containing protein n=1 Tax=Spartinivicinus marinus TaxID=2994442 RepID=A0A853I6A4_9GAMM|nr:hypothetical protein [Spartinivicinus marinus]MCX4030001.1 hypothetical protein [Spartinivicinus marinus]NYZ64755.1 hypothetical protein [Spartinivicinus marinus]